MNDVPGPENETAGDGAFHMSYEDSCDRVPVLWIHGYPLNNMLWDIQLNDLTDIARMIAPDLRGHGMTDPTEPPYSMGLFADDCAALLDHLGIFGPVVVGGLSMGGYVAFEFCRKYPDKVAGLILAGPIAEGMLPKLLAPGNYKDQPDLVDYVREMMLETSPDGVVGALAAMRDRPDSTPDLAALDVPVLILHGAEDQLIPVTEAEAMAAALPSAKLVVVPGAGHLPNLEQPEIFNDAVREFLEIFYGE